MASGSQQPLKRVRQMLVREREPGELPSPICPGLTARSGRDLLFLNRQETFNIQGPDGIGKTTDYGPRDNGGRELQDLSAEGADWRRLKNWRESAKSAGNIQGWRSVETSLRGNDGDGGGDHAITQRFHDIFSFPDAAGHSPALRSQGNIQHSTLRPDGIEGLTRLNISAYVRS